MPKSLPLRAATCALAASLLALVLAACGGQVQSVSSGKSEGSKNLVFGTPAFDETIASNYLWKVLLEKQGYKVTVKTMDVAPIYIGVANGQIDGSMGLAPISQVDYWSKYDNQFDALNSWYSPVVQGVAVPKSLGITSMDQLAPHAAELGSQIIGIEPGSGLMGRMPAAIKDYGLEKFKIVGSSTPTMLAALDKATKENKPIAVALWQPHWAFSKYPMVLLDDPKKAFGGADSMRTVVSKDFVKSHPDVAAEMAKFKLGPDELQSLELMITDAGQGNEETAVKSWIAKNQDLVDGWTKSS
jgi:glycine betaine/proline transport system substrate-binding protein